MDYRYVVLNSSGKATRADDWSCPSDVEAIDRARHEAAPYGAELWRADRRLSVLPPRLAPADG